jgi:hypothetical protein
LDVAGPGISGLLILIFRCIGSDDVEVRMKKADIGGCQRPCFVEVFEEVELSSVGCSVGNE